MRVTFALLLAIAGVAIALPASAGETLAKREYCNPCTIPCLSDEPCIRADRCAPGEQHTPDQCPGLDDDGDAIANAQDKCPLEKGIPETAGCPVTDADADGIADYLDRCVYEKGIPEEQGCPVRDADGDGIADARDRCPQEAGTAADEGCPPRDADGDGIADAQDRCPQQPGVAAEQGCPPALAQISTETKRIEIKDKIFFDTGKATIQARSYELLDDVAALLVANSSVPSVVVEGHTDSRGPAELNRALSLARAEAVKAYLVQKNVDPSRLQTRGVGPDEPAQPNDTASGREANRRVELVVGE